MKLTDVRAYLVCVFRSRFVDGRAFIIRLVLDDIHIVVKRAVDGVFDKNSLYLFYFYVFQFGLFIVFFVLGYSLGAG